MEYADEFAASTTARLNARMVTRNVPPKVLKILREEVGFHCPADKDGEICGSPYLTWHHFDPPWRIEKHHRPDGMIALCREHADKADNKSYTDDQLRLLKKEGKGRGAAVSGRFDWMRQKMVAFVGGNAFVDAPQDIIIQKGQDPVLWFSENGNGEKMVNFRIPTLPGMPPRAALVDNFWTVLPKDATSFECPPNGRKLFVSYANGDYFRCEFDVIENGGALKKKLPRLEYVCSYNFEYPFTMVKIEQELEGLYPKFTEDYMDSGTMKIGDTVMQESIIQIIV